MSDSTLQAVWSPDDYREVLERAATARAHHCPAALTQHGVRYGCDILVHHKVHENFALGAAWVDDRGQ